MNINLVSLRVELAKQQMTQRGLARILGIAPTTLSGWLLAGHAPPDVVERLAGALCVDPEVLVRPPHEK